MASWRSSGYLLILPVVFGVRGVQLGVEIDDDVVLPAGSAEVGELVRMRGESETLRAQVVAETRRAATVLRRAGLSTRDVGEILGISGTRVAQIEREASSV